MEFILKSAQGQGRKDRWAQSKLDFLRGDDRADPPGLGLQWVTTLLF